MRMVKSMAGALAAAMCIAGAANGQVVISQVYGGGGNSMAVFTHDFVELKNIGSTPQSLAGWSVQYASSAGNFNNKYDLPAITLEPGQYALFQQSGGVNGVALPTPDGTGTLAMSGSSGKVALVNTTTLIVGNCADPSVLDLVGWGSGASCSEGSPAGGTANPTAVIRQNGGCQDFNDNSIDFIVATPTPRNTSSAYSACGGGSTPPTALGSAEPFVVCTGDDVTLSAVVTPGSGPMSTGITVTGNLSPIGGSSTQMFMDIGGDVFEFTQTVGVGVSAGLTTINMQVSDAEGRSSTFQVEVIVNRCSPSSTGLIEPQTLCSTAGGFARVVVFVNPASTGNFEFAPGSITADLTLIGGSATQELFNDGTNGDRLAGDTAWTYELAIPPTPVSVRTITWTGMDGDGRPISGMAELTFIECTDSASDVVISQVYGGGGNTGAVYTHDFIELFNRGSAPVDISGWSVQYASETGGFNNKIDLPDFVIQPGQYFLVRGAAGNSCGGQACGEALPVAEDASGNLNMGGSAGKIALVSSTTLIAGNCTDPAVADLVAYGANASCFEGLSSAANAGNAVALLRLQNGCQDHDQNGPDFYPGTPMPRNSSSAFNVCESGPTTGACCTLDRSCTILSEQDCIAAGGSFLGNGAACSQLDCDQVNVACCIATECQFIPLGACFFQGGSSESFESCTGVACGPQFCDADWCQDGSVGVPDIFCFLSDWFAQDPEARNYGGTEGVPAIFAFLSEWFGTGQGPCTP